MEEKQEKQGKQAEPWRDCFKVMLDWIDPIRNSSAEEFKAIILALTDFACYGREADMSKVSEKAVMAWNFILPQARRMNEYYGKMVDRNRANGRKGGRPHKGQGCANDEAETDIEEDREPPNRLKNQNNPKNPVGCLGYFGKPQKSIREDKSKIIIRKDNLRKEEDKQSASVLKDAYSPSSLGEYFSFINPSFSQPFSDFLIYLAKSHKDLMPKTVEQYKEQYERLVKLAQHDSNEAQKIVGNTISHGWAKLYPLKKTKEDQLREGMDKMLSKYGLTVDDVGY